MPRRLAFKTDTVYACIEKVCSDKALSTDDICRITGMQKNIVRPKLTYLIQHGDIFRTAAIPYKYFCINKSKKQGQLISCIAADEKIDASLCRPGDIRWCKMCEHNRGK